MSYNVIKKMISSFLVLLRKDIENFVSNFPVWGGEGTFYPLSPKCQTSKGSKTDCAQADRFNAVMQSERQPQGYCL